MLSVSQTFSEKAHETMQGDLSEILNKVVIHGNAVVHLSSYEEDIARIEGDFEGRRARRELEDALDLLIEGLKYGLVTMKEDTE